MIQLGVIILKELPRSVKMIEIRPAVFNNEISYETVMRAVRTNEYKAIVKNYFNELPEMNSFNMFDICKDLMSQIPYGELNELLIKELKKRKSNIEDIKFFKKELRQVGLAMNMNDDSYKNLFLKLNKPIQI